jgi:hypothetical protein
LISGAEAGYELVAGAPRRLIVARFFEDAIRAALGGLVPEGVDPAVAVAGGLEASCDPDYRPIPRPYYSPRRGG